MSELKFSGLSPKPEYLLQYPVLQVVQIDDNLWQVEFEGGAIIGVEDGSQVPDLNLDPEGKEQTTLMRAIYSETETRLFFGKLRQGENGPEPYDEVEITVEPGKYFIAGDTRFPDSLKHYPGMAFREDAVERRATAEETDWNTLRTQEGPQEPEDASGGLAVDIEDDGA